QLLERGLGRPAEPAPRLRGVALEDVDLGRPEVARIDLDEHAPGLRVRPLLFQPLPAPGELEAGAAERALAELAHRVGFPGRDDVIVGLLLLEHEPHRLDVVLRVAPVAPRSEVAEVEAVLEAVPDAPHGARDLARHERLAAALALVVEEDSVD